LEFKYRVVNAAPMLPKQIDHIENLNFETLSFLITYVIPLFCFDLDFDLNENRNFLMLILVLIIIGWIYVKTNIFYTNPSLAILGYRIYKVQTSKTRDMIVIVMGKLKKGDKIYPKRIDENIFFVKKSQQNG
jgi:hypothetical protein